MLIKTRGIVFKTIKYGDTSLIVKIYTEALGLQTYLMQGVRKAKSKTHANLFQSLSLLELDAYARKNKNFQRAKEVKAGSILTDLPFNILKGSIVMFLTEALIKCIKEEEPNESLFGFIWDQVVLLDSLADEKLGLFHHQFLISLSEHLGFFPSAISEKPNFFDMQEGVFCEENPLHGHVLEGQEANAVYALVNNTDESEIKLMKKERAVLINNILKYYRLHVYGFGELKSLKVLETILG